MNQDANPPGTLNSKGYAEHRGCTPAYISRLKKEGRLAPPALLPSGLINVALADQMLGSPATARELPLTGSAPSFASERALREQRTRERIELDMQERELQLARIRGETRLKCDVERETFEVLRRLRDKMLSIPSQMADKVAAESSPRIVEHLLRKAISEALGHIADELEADATKVEAG